MRLPSNEQRTPGQGNTNLLRQGIAAYRDPDGFRLYLVAVGFTVASLPYFTAGVSSTPGLAKLVGGCNPRPGCRVVRSTPGGLSPSLRAYRALIEPTAYAAGALYYWRQKNLFHQAGG